MYIIGAWNWLVGVVSNAGIGGCINNTGVAEEWDEVSTDVGR